MRNFFGLIFILLFAKSVNSQCTNPPNGVDCTCGTAQILCTPDDLDGFTFSMSASNNNGGIPSNDLCPPVNGIGGVPNNVNWFAFIAWCTDLTINVTANNCTGGPTGGGNMSYGAQIAVFETCGFPWDPVQCITEGVDACGNSPTNYPSMQTLTLGGLIIGNVYYFMLDGCAGSACDITIDVPQVCGTGTIDPWTTGLTGPLTSCVGNTETYIAEDVNGAVEFYYFLDGLPLIDGTELTSISQTWNTAGTYQLCVDVGNDPCIPVTDNPPQSCIDIVICDAADAGIININTSPACPGETINFDVTAYTDTPDHDQYVIITDPNGMILEVNAGNIASYSSSICESFKVFSYNLKIGSTAPAVGTNFPMDYPCLDNCCDSVEATFSFEDMIPPVFTNPPASVTLDCDAALNPITDLDYTDNCIPDGSVSGTETGTSDPCTGGTLTREWTITDMCDNTGTHTQTITVNPLAVATIMNPPADITVECTGIPTSASDLNYDNSSPGMCSVMGTLTPVLNSPADLCGGTNTITWSTTDVCGRLIEHVQNITVNPTAVATYINPPANVTFSCENEPTSFPNLDYSNGLSGSCEIMGTVSPSVVDNADICGGTITVTWSDTDPCGRLIEYIQTITIDPAPPSSYDNLPPNQTVDCNQIPTTFPDLNHTNGVTGDCNISNTITPNVIDNSTFCGGTITVNWNDTDACSRLIDHQQVFTVNAAPQAQFINPPADITVDCNMAPSMAADLTLTNMEMGTCLISSTVTPVLSGTNSPCGTTLQFTWDYLDLCGRTTNYVQNVTVNPAALPVFDPTPPDITVSCDNIPANNISLAYTNGESGDCQISGSVLASRTGSFDACGGVLLDTWSFTDACGTVIISTRSIQVEPASIPIFTNPPADITIDCSDVDNQISTIAYDNNEAGPCRIFGTVNAITSGSYDECGGQILQVYSAADDCGRALSYTRTISINPAPAAQFVDPPQDVNLDCDMVFNPPVTLSYTNNLTGVCEIFGTAPLVSTTDGITTTNEWSYLDPCTNNIVTHIQIVTGFTAADILLNPDFAEICIGQSFDLSTINYFDFNNNVVSLSFHTGFPTNTANELTNPIVSPTMQTTYIVSAKTAEGCETVEPFIIYVVDGSDAGPNVSDEICLDNTTTDLFQFLDTTSPQDGFWLELEGNGVDVSDGYNVNLNNLASGVYHFYYLTNASAFCPPDTAILSLTVIGEIPFTTENIDCSADQMSYGFMITVANDIMVNSNLGTITDQGSGVYSIDMIDINQSVIITLSSSQHTCTETLTINPPNCNCPDIDPPTGTEIYRVCLAELPLTISVFTAAELEANWYDSPSSTSPIASATDDYIFNQTSVGLYTLYVESIEPISMCTSTDRLAIDIEVVAAPIVDDFLIETCDDNLDGMLDFDLENIRLDLSSNPALNISIYPTATDRSNQSNELSGLYNSNSALDTLYVLSTNSANCESNSLLILSVLALPSLNISTTDESCQNANDGIAVFDDISASSYTLIFMGQDLGTDLMIENLAPGDYNYLLIDEDLCQTEGILSIDPAATIVIAGVMSDCSDEGTETDPSDDIYTLDFLVENFDNPTGTFTLLQGSDDIGQFNYNSNSSITLVADGNSYTLYVRDDLNLCLDSFLIGPLFPCSTNCEIQIDQLNSECNDNGSAQDPSDDFYTVAINISAINGGINQKYQLLNNNMIIGVYDYGMAVQFDIPANNTSNSFLIVDLDDNQCSASLDLGILSPCSTGCSVNIDILSSVCDQNNTTEDINDDSYTIDLNVTEVNTNNSSFNLEIDGVLVANFDYNMDFSINIDADGMSHTLRAIDTSNDQCVDQTDTDLLEPCSFPCIDSVIATVTNEIDCNNTTATLSSSVSSAVANYSWVYQGIEIATTSETTIGNAGFYEINVLFTNGCTATDIVEVIKDDQVPTADAGPDVILNCTNDIAVLGGGMTSNGSAYTYEWRDSDGTIVSTDISFNTQDSGSYTLQVFDLASMCKSSIEEVLVSSNFTIPSAIIIPNPGDVLDCVIASIILSSANEANVSYRWGLPEGSSSNETTITINSPGTYTLEAFHILSECIDTSTITITDFEDYPNLSISSVGVLGCNDQGVLLIANYDSENDNLEATWQDSNGTIISTTTDSLEINTPGLYFVTIMDLSNGCVNLDSIDIQENINTFDIDIATSIMIDQGSSTRLSANTDLEPALIDTIVWTNDEFLSCSNCLNPEVLISENQNFTIIITDIYGCTAHATIEIIIIPQEDIYTPNVIHPNSDQDDNRRFTIFSSDNEAIIEELLIFDRWGNKVYSNKNLPINNPAFGWDGTFKGKRVSQGVYVYLAKIALSNGQEERLSGDVTVLF